LWDAETGRQIGAPFKCGDRIMAAAFSPDGTRIVTALVDGTARLWDAATGRQIGTPLVGHVGVVNSAVFSPDGRRIVTASPDGTARLWDAATDAQTGAPLLDGHAGVVSSVAFSPDGTRIVSGSGELDWFDDRVNYPGEVKVWDAATGQEMLSLKGHTGYVSSVAISRDGTRIVSGSHDGTVKVWDAPADKP
jgi:WD40 repeat protein